MECCTTFRGTLRGPSGVSRSRLWPAGCSDIGTIAANRPELGWRVGVGDGSGYFPAGTCTGWSRCGGAEGVTSARCSRRAAARLSRPACSMRQPCGDRVALGGATEQRRSRDGVETEQRQSGHGGGFAVGAEQEHAAGGDAECVGGVGVEPLHVERGCGRHGRHRSGSRPARRLGNGCRGEWDSPTATGLRLICRWRWQTRQV